jgi:ubiquinone/menaquinone biosynthesis C-methylase UbiE
MASYLRRFAPLTKSTRHHPLTHHNIVTASFGSTPETCNQSRTNFSDASVEWLLGGILPDHLDPLDISSRTTRHDVLDLGAGEGKLTQAVLNARPDLKLVGVDPVAKMCAEYSNNLPKADVLQGSGESIPLLDNSVYAVVVGQAFHRFASAATLAEISRVLVPGGGLGIIWNTHDTSVSWVKELDNIIQPYYVEQSGDWMNVFDTTKNYTNTTEGELLFHTLERKTFHSIENGLTFDDILNHVLPLSVIANQSMGNQNTMKNQIRELIHEHPDTCKVGTIGQPMKKGQFSLPYVTEMYITRNLKPDDELSFEQSIAARIDPDASKALGLDIDGTGGRGGNGRVSEIGEKNKKKLDIKKLASEALQLDDFFGQGVGNEEEEEEEDEDFVDFTDPTTGEWNSPTKGGRMPEPTRHGDWHHKGRCTDF